jgi:hypothetical protein
MIKDIIIIILGGLVSGLFILPKRKRKQDNPSTINPFAYSIRLDGKTIKAINKKVD